MDYSSLSNAALMLLQLAAERPGLSGYDVNRVVIERGYRHWAGIGRTSVYSGLKRLEGMGLMTSGLDEAKRGQGPLPRRYHLTPQGRRVLRAAVREALADASGPGSRFDLGLAGLPAVNREEARAALKKRTTRLKEAAARLAAEYESQGGDQLPPQARAVFDHSFSRISHEIAFTSRLAETLF